MSDDKFSYDSIQDITSIKQYFSALLESIEKRRIVLKSENKEIILNVNELFRFAVQAKKKGCENKLSIKMSWTNKSDAKDNDAKTLTIG